MDVTAEQLDTESINTLKPLNQQFCKECGAAMTDADRISENGAIYIWYECSKSGCNGSWLKKLKKPEKNEQKS